MDWKLFFNSALRFPFDNIYYESLTIHSGGLDYDDDSRLSFAEVCNNRDILDQLIFSLVNGVSFDRVCNFVRFRVENCPVSGVTFCANCRRICQPSTCQLPVEQGNVYLNPCDTCESHNALYQVNNSSPVLTLTLALALALTLTLFSYFKRPLIPFFFFFVARPCIERFLISSTDSKYFIQK